MTMRILVLGSTGRTGRLVLSLAASRGHAVTAFARRSADLDGVAGLAAIVEGDGRDPSAVVPAVAGHDAVVMAVAGRGESDVAVGIAGTVVAAMASCGVSRLVATSAYGMVAKRPRIVASVVRRVFADQFADQIAADRVIEASALEWTILRASRLVAARGARPARESGDLFTTGPYSLSRAALAESLLRHAEDGADVRRIINISG
jgi:putative NADH-flavin reductase